MKSVANELETMLERVSDIATHIDEGEERIEQALPLNAIHRDE